MFLNYRQSSPFWGKTSAIPVTNPKTAVKPPPPKSYQKGRFLMNNADLAEKIAADHGVTKADARKLVDGVFAAIADAAAAGEEISINGFGKFKVKATPEREGRNPGTGATITIKASKKLGFTPAKAVKDKLNG